MKTPWPEVALGELMASKGRAVNPALFPSEIFSLYSIPAFDNGEPTVVPGAGIGSSKQAIEPGDVLLSKIVPHIRRVWDVGLGSDKRMIGSSEWIVFRGGQVHPPYLRNLLASDSVHRQFMQTVSGVGGSLLRARPSLVAKIRVPLPPIGEQRRIAAVLDQADELRTKRRASLALLGSLAESIFLDLALGSAGVLEVQLGAVSSILGGLQITRTRTTNPIQVPYLRVANVHRGALELREIKHLRATASELARTRLEAGDLLVVEGHGNPGEIGRVARWTGTVDPCVHQNHLIRVRVDRDQADPAYLEAFLNSRRGRQELLRAANTTSGLNTISVGDVRDIVVGLPPIWVQRQFAERVEGLALLTQGHRSHLAVLDALFASLQHRAFSGAL